MRSSWLYLATRSERHSEPVLICVALVPTAMSAMVRVLGLARAVRDDRGVARARRHLDRGERLGQRADLVDLDQDRVGDLLRRCPPAGSSVLVTNRSSPTSCTLLAEPLGQQLPAVPVALGHAVLDRDDRILRRPACEVVGELRRGELAAFADSRSYLPSSKNSRARARRGRGRRLSPGLVAGLARSPRGSSRAPPRSTAGPARSRLRRRPRCASPRSCSTFFSAWKISAP